MKAIFGIFALFLVAANAGIIEQPINYEGLINDIIHDSKQVAIDTLHQLEHQYEGIVLDPLHQVEEALNSIEERAEEEEACVAAQTPYVEAVVSDMHDDINSCGIVAAKDSAQIAGDVATSAEQLVVEGYAVLQTYQKCQSYKNSVLKNACLARLSIQASLYTVKARRSIKTIKAAPQRVPVVFSDADTCTHVASEKALTNLEVVHKNIDACGQKF